MKKKNKQKRQQKRKQAKALKSQRRRKDFLREKRNTEALIIRWDDLYFLDGWKSLDPETLMDKCFKFTVEDWVFEWVRPKKLRDYNTLYDLACLETYLHQTFDNTLEAWAIDTNGFTENLPERWKYNQKNQNKFVNIMMTQDEDDEAIDYTEEEVRELMEKDRSEWFSTVFSEMINEMVEKLTPYVYIQIKTLSFQD
jgi:hypothetical protein